MNVSFYGVMATAIGCLFLSSCAASSTGYWWPRCNIGVRSTFLRTEDALRRGTGTPRLPHASKVVDWNDGGRFASTFVCVDAPHTAVVDFLVRCEPLHRTVYGASMTRKNADTTRYEWTGPAGPAWMTVQRLNADMDRVTLGN